jgi:hypothetical protein
MGRWNVLEERREEAGEKKQSLSALGLESTIARRVEAARVADADYPTATA